MPAYHPAAKQQQSLAVAPCGWLRPLSKHCVRRLRMAARRCVTMFSPAVKLAILCNGWLFMGGLARRARSAQRRSKCLCNPVAQVSIVRVANGEIIMR